MAILIKEKDDQFFQKNITLTSNPEDLKGLLNETRWNILKTIAEKPRYPAQIAKILKIHEQKVDYHIKQLEAKGLIEVKTREEISGALAKYYNIKSYAYALELPYGDEKISDFSPKDTTDSTRQFLYPFIKGGILNSKIVVGSPDPHGPYQVRARDSHYAIDIALFLGQFAKTPKQFSTKLDIDVISEKKQGTNMIILGGPLTNILTHDINNYLPIKFNLEKYPFRGITSTKTGKTYNADNIGLIAKIVNPHNTEKSILLIAGNRFNGTKGAVLALTRHTKELINNYNGEDNWATIVEGLDMDGDGKVDSIKILE